MAKIIIKKQINNSQQTVSLMQLERIKQKFSLLPLQIKKLNEKPNFIVQSLQNFNSKNAVQVISSIKTRTMLSLLDAPKLTFNDQISNVKPIILVFCQPSQQLNIDSKNIYPYVPISYCSWLESAGARCIPIAYNINQGSIQYLLQISNGIIIPGGGANLYKNYQEKQGYGPVTVGFQKIWRYINKLWNRGVYFPIWGTCLGLQLVLMAITNDVKILSNLNSRMHQLQIYPDYQRSTIFQDMPSSLKIQIENRKIINFQHAHGISVQKYNLNQKLKQKLFISSVSKDKSGVWFCSALQGRINPIFLSQFHPQKQAFQWSKNGDILHEKYSIKISQFFGQKIVSQCRKCKPSKQVSNQKQLILKLVQQYKQIYTPLKMYKVYAIDYKYLQSDPKTRKKIRSQKAMSGQTKTILSKIYKTNKKIQV